MSHAGFVLALMQLLGDALTPIVHARVFLGALCGYSGLLVKLVHHFLMAFLLGLNELQIIIKNLEVDRKVLTIMGPVQNRQVHREIGNHVSTYFYFRERCVHRGPLQWAVFVVDTLGSQKLSLVIPFSWDLVTGCGKLSTGLSLDKILTLK